MTAGSNKDAVRRRFLRFASYALLPALYLFFVKGSAGAQQDPGAEQPQLKVTVNRVNVGATVTDQNGRFASGLTRAAFHIFDNDIEQPIVDFLPTEEPTQFLLLIESGPAVMLFARNHVLAADGLLQSVAANDRVGIATYSRTPELLLDFTTNKDIARTALTAIDFQSGYGELELKTAIATALDSLTRLPGKKSLVLISTGVDSSDRQDFSELRRELQIADVRMFSVSLSATIQAPVNPKKLSARQLEARAKVAADFLKADSLMKELAEATGGRAYFARNAEEFRKSYAEIAELLRHEYSLSFAPTSLDGKVHALRVEVEKTGLKVDHRPAYLAAPPETSK